MNVYVLNTLGIGLDTIDLIRRRLQIAGVIGLSDREPGHSISDFVYQAAYCRSRDLDFVEVESYALGDPADQRALLDLEIDVLLVMGWQRLIPAWLIDHCKICAIGSHGSPLGITKGRGRSPQNWALMLGMDTFDISIFEIDPGVDSGRVIDTRKFSYSGFDDIKTSYYKVSLLTSEMIADALQSTTFAEKNFSPQEHGEAEYFPQRTPQDGAIDWGRTNHDIARFVRALTRPYPGAHTHVGDQEVRVWSAIPFDIDVHSDCAPGEILKIFNKNDVLVKSAEGYVLIDDYESASDGFQLSEGMRFTSRSFREQMNQIMDRHEAKHPSFPLAAEIKKFRAT